MIDPGFTAVAVLLIGFLIIERSRKYQWLLATLLLAVITPIALSGFLFSDNRLGISDWDYYFSYHHNVRKTVIEHQQLPHWNPWTCGGTAGLADPEFPLFTPTFLLELLFGIPIGFRLAIFLSVGITAIGFLWLASKLRFSVGAGLVSALAITFGSVTLLEIVEGHPNVFAVMWIPWVLGSWLTTYRAITPKQQRTWSIATGVFLALMFMQGGIYLLMYMAIAFTGLGLAAPHRIRSATTSLKVGLWAIGFSAFKLLPVFFWLRQFQDLNYASSASTLRHLKDIFLVRHLHRAGDIIPNQGSGWHEYGAYIGYAVAILALIGLFKVKQHRIIQALLLSAISAILISSSGPTLKPVFDEISFIPRSNISRFVLFAVIPIGLLAGYGFDQLKKLFQRISINRISSDQPSLLTRIFNAGSSILHVTIQSVIPFLLLGAVGIELLTISQALSRQAFVLPHVYPVIEPAPEPIAFNALEFKTRHKGDDFSRAYDATRTGYGSMIYCSVLTPPPAVKTIHSEDPKDRLVISLSQDDATFDLISWSPNKVVVSITTDQSTEVLLNSNYATGWKINGQPAKNIQDRPGIEIEENTTLTFSYHSPGFNTGLVVTILTIISALAITRKPQPSNHPKV